MGVGTSGLAGQHGQQAAALVERDQVVTATDVVLADEDLPHTVPLSKQALQVIAAIEPTAGTDLVFPSPRGKVLSDMTLTAVMRRMQLDAVPHGFRSTFRTWGGEQTAYPRDLLETALAHTLESKVEAAYMHGTQIEKRRKLMQEWADYVDLAKAQGNNVVSLKAVSH